MTCEHCLHWSFRVETDTAWGACISPIARNMFSISTVKCDIDRKCRKEIGEFAEVCTRSDFSCRYFEDDAKSTKMNDTGRCDKTIDLFADYKNCGE